ncbi:uncharacterized protein F4822DRAFT_405255 [Hypoxylon trugodes]|uniref:uncharacterized protein n=1 Tax=Hypoxylon trugodes TaxID=326681 RepID=UPI0021963855|nr:uncharacterized protein F4822DRAFT_405255 [Hypoxylon trugodes]KAI1389182.1 hypothetical protein F4822DRAFT_405255 [Hypoxylon trugodes]
MGTRRFGRSRSILSLLLLTVLFLLYRYTGTSDINSPKSITTIKMTDSTDVISKLTVSIRQVSSTSPPKLAIAVTNANSSPVTILTWNSPLDPLALQLGLVSFVPTGSDNEEAVHMPKIQIRRKMPPGPESLVTIGAGQTREQELELRQPIVPLEKLRGRPFSVVCKGEWTGVWLSEADGVSKASLEKAGASDDAYKGTFESEAVVV